MSDDLNSLSREELKLKLKEYQLEADRYYNYEQSVKRILNSIYGAFGNEWFYFYNIDIAEAITLQGQDAILYAEKMLNHYFTEFWHKDIELHEKLGVKCHRKVIKPVVIYIDTDSVAAASKIVIDNVEQTIEESFRNYAKENGIEISQKGDEIIKNPNCKILNYDGEKLYHAPVSKIIRHKVRKSKWRLKTKSGKDVIVTNDHSMMVLRNNKLIKVKPNEINPKIDKVVSIHKTKR